MAQELQRLTHVHQAIVELALQGLDRTEIARLMARTPASIGLIMNSPLFQDELARRRGVRQTKLDDVAIIGKAEAGRILEQNAGQAAGRIAELMSSDDEKIALASAKDILDRTYGRGAAAENTTSVTVLNVDKMQVLISALKESKELESQFVPEPESGSDPGSESEPL